MKYLLIPFLRYQLFLWNFCSILIIQGCKSTIYNKINDLIEKNSNILINYYNTELKHNKLYFKNLIVSGGFINFHWCKTKKSTKPEINSLPKVPSDESEIIYKIDYNGKIIVIGDNHGSFHSFFRIILRLYLKGIITNNYKLKENYKLILLGDVVDRGNYSIELLFILFNLMLKNNTEFELNVILIRGNHEEESTYRRYGFSTELNKKFEKEESYTIKKNIRTFFKYCPSAIILKNNGATYWLCHGGIPKNYSKYNFNHNIKSTINQRYDNQLYDNQLYDNQLYDNQNIINNKNAIIERTVFVNNIKSNEFEQFISEIRWNDFTAKKESNKSSRIEKCNKNCIYFIGENDYLKFLNDVKIDFIIRGHSDNISNAMLLANTGLNEGNNSTFYILNKKNEIDYYKELSKKALVYHTTNNSKGENQVVTIYPKKFDRQNIVGTDNIKKICPILTISNNCDKDRNLYSDSYIIIKGI